MTSLLPDRGTDRDAGPRACAGDGRSTASLGHDLRHRRPLILVAAIAGSVAAAATLVVCLAVGVTGWFLTDAGTHGAPRDGLRTGALAWLMAHGSGVRVDGVLVTAIPLGITAACAWAIWRTASRLGDSISGHGPDADGIADGQRDWTVPAASMIFIAAYLATAVFAGTLAGTPATAPDLGHVAMWSIALSGAFGIPAIAIGSGRAAVWSSWAPAGVISTLTVCRYVLTTWAWACAAFFVGALLLDFDTALNLLSQLGTDAAGTSLLLLVSALLIPNAMSFSGAYLLGPGFTVGVGTLVSPAQVTVGALPLFPLLAALPDPGPTPGWTLWLVAVPPAVAALGVARALRRRPTLRYDEGALFGCAGGMIAGVGFAVLAAVAGGRVGPGRMSDVGPLVGPVLVHAITAFGIGGLIGGLAITWWQRRATIRACEPPTETVEDTL
ncbi:DUF6350 family protein [Nocardioides sp.]|uniref:cell division protein PerM n=1 Tax=Nocardioides sp. TaxID=35761 RepID=UPI00356480B6